MRLACNIKNQFELCSGILFSQIQVGSHAMWSKGTQCLHCKVHVLGISKTRLLSNNKTRLLGSSKTRLLGNSKIHPQGSCKAHLPICKVHLSSYKVAFLFIRLGFKLKWTIKVFLSVDINVFCQFKNLSLLIKAIKCFLMYLLLL